MKTTSSELQRCAEEAVRNELRLAQWRARYTLATGREPVRVLNPPITTDQRVELMKAQRAAISNANVVKMPRRKRQYMHTTLPSTFEPDPAA
ncbi:MAG: hypothetical protein OQK24_15110 [Magnetovibrio sp.]|nr:hypothetical protein [Magnetovibrio sp.]